MIVIAFNFADLSVWIFKHFYLSLFQDADFYNILFKFLTLKIAYTKQLILKVVDPKHPTPRTVHLKVMIQTTMLMKWTIQRTEHTILLTLTIVCSKLWIPSLWTNDFQVSGQARRAYTLDVDDFATSSFEDGHINCKIISSHVNDLNIPSELTKEQISKQKTSWKN